MISKIFYSLVGLQIRWPYLIYIPCLLVFSNGSIFIKLLILAICLLINFYYNLIPYYLSQYFHTRPAFEFVQKYKHSEFIKHRPADYFREDVLSFDLRNIMGVSESSIRKWFNKNIDENTYIFQIKPVKGNKYPRNAKVFTGEFGTLVFVTERPKGIKPFSKFKLLHEYFHSSEISLFFERELIFISTLPILFLLILFIFIEISCMTIGLTFIALLLLWFENKFYWSRKKHQSKFMAEQLSDMLAIKFLDNTEKEKLKNSPYLDNLIGDDRSLNLEENKIRKENFKYFITHGVDDYTWNEIINISYSEHSTILHFMIFFIFLVFCGFSRQLTWWTALVCLFVLILFFIISMILCRTAYRYYANQCEEALGINLTQSPFFKRNSLDNAEPPTG